MSKAIITTILIFLILFIGGVLLSLGYVDVFNPLVIFIISLFAIGIIVFIIIKLVRGFLLRHQTDENAIYVHRTLLYSGILGVIIAIPFFVKSFSSPGVIDDIIVFAALPPLLIFEFLLFFFVMRKWLKISFYVLSPLNILLLVSFFVLSGIASGAGDGGSYILLPWIFATGGVFVIAGITILIDVIRLIIKRKKEFQESRIADSQQQSFFYFKRNRIALILLGTIVVFQLILVTTPLMTLSSTWLNIWKQADPAVVETIFLACQKMENLKGDENQAHLRQSYSTPEPYILNGINGEKITVQKTLKSPIDIFVQRKSYCDRIKGENPSKSLVYEFAGWASFSIIVSEENRYKIKDKSTTGEIPEWGKKSKNPDYWYFTRAWEAKLKVVKDGKTSYRELKYSDTKAIEPTYEYREFSNYISNKPYFIMSGFFKETGSLIKENPQEIYFVLHNIESGKEFEIPFSLEELKEFHYQ